MEPSGLVAYVLTLAAVTAAPGPLIALLITLSLESDRTGAVMFAAGWCAGKVVAVALVFAGLATWAQGNPEVIATAKYIGVTYLIWVSVRMWRPAVSRSPSASGGKSLCSSGSAFLLSISSPYSMVLYLVLLPGLLHGDASGAMRFAIVSLVTVLVLAVVLGGVILLASWPDGSWRLPAVRWPAAGAWPSSSRHRLSGWSPAEFVVRKDQTLASAGATRQLLHTTLRPKRRSGDPPEGPEGPHL